MKIKDDRFEFLERREAFASISVAERSKIFRVLCTGGVYPLKELQEFFGMFREEVIEVLKGLNIEFPIDPAFEEAASYKRVEWDDDYIVDHITFQAGPRSIDRNLVASMHLEKKFSAAQIAEELGCSKTLVITTLKRMGILRPMMGARTVPTNYLHKTPPYGFRVVKNQLLINRKELKLCRLIVNLVARKGMNFSKTALRLKELGFRNRKGDLSWHSYTVSRIYRRWKDRI